MENFEAKRAHYELEKSLAQKLKMATRTERAKLYAEVYDELYQRMPNLKNPSNSAYSIRYAKAQLRFMSAYLTRKTTLLEIGPGNCAVAVEASKVVSKIILVDVSKEITGDTVLPDNCQLILSDGISIPVPAASVNVVFSNQVIEHLHPEDALIQLKSVWDALAPGGLYLCVAPNRLSGPYDISRDFDEIATCFHLKEYTNEELGLLFKKAGYSKVRARVGGKGYYLLVPFQIIAVLENLLAKLPFRLRQRIAGAIPFRWLLGIKLIAFK